MQKAREEIGGTLVDIFNKSTQAREVAHGNGGMHIYSAIVQNGKRNEPCSHRSVSLISVILCAKSRRV